jgi:hypothetical protein
MKINKIYLKWIDKKINEHTEAFHHKRLFIENLIYKYKQSFSKTTNHNRLKLDYFKYFIKVFEKDFNCIIFSFKVFLLYVEGNIQIYKMNMKKGKNFLGK